MDEPGKDGRGLVISGSHFVQIGPLSSDFREKAEEIYNEPIVAFSPIENASSFGVDQLQSVSVFNFIDIRNYWMFSSMA